MKNNNLKKIIITGLFVFLGMTTNAFAYNVEFSAGEIAGQSYVADGNNCVSFTAGILPFGVDMICAPDYITPTANGTDSWWMQIGYNVDQMSVVQASTGATITGFAVVTPPATVMSVGTGTTFFADNGNLLTGSVGDAVQLTTTDLTPIVAVVGGIILAFIGVRFIVSLVKKTGNK